MSVDDLPYPALHPDNAIERNIKMQVMLETEFPAFWQTALRVAADNRQIALSMCIRMVRRLVEIGAKDAEDQLNESI